MNHAKNIITATGMILFFMLSTLALAPGVGVAQEARIIKIYGDFPSGKTAETRVEPQETWVARGTTVVWQNLSKNEIKIVFPKGKECQAATGGRLLWKLDARSCLITDFNIPYGGTTSALFNAIGRYDYEIEYVGQTAKEKGSIIVRTMPGSVY